MGNKVKKIYSKLKFLNSAKRRNTGQFFSRILPLVKIWPEWKIIGLEVVRFGVERPYNIYTCFFVSPINRWDVRIFEEGIIINIRTSLNNRQIWNLYARAYSLPCVYIYIYIDFCFFNQSVKCLNIWKSIFISECLLIIGKFEIYMDLRISFHVYVYIYYVHIYKKQEEKRTCVYISSFSISPQRTFVLWIFYFYSEMGLFVRFDHFPWSRLRSIYTVHFSNKCIVCLLPNKEGLFNSWYRCLQPCYLIPPGHFLWILLYVTWAPATTNK